MYSGNRRRAKIYRKISILIENILNMIKFISKSRPSIRIRLWNPNRTVIDDRIWTEISIRQRQFDLVPLIALAYIIGSILLDVKLRKLACV